MSGDPLRFAPLTGVIAAFDDRAGWGTLATESGDEVFFHCTHIADGSRTIPVGVAAEAFTLPIGPGTWEAVAVRRVGD